MIDGWATQTIPVFLSGESVPICVGERRGSGTAVLYLHGLGSTMHDFASALTHPAFAERWLLSLDFPGCGRSGYPSTAGVRVDDLVAMTQTVVDALVGNDRIAIVGHSMGGYVGLRYAASSPSRVESFVNIEGNLAPEDCAIISRDTAAQAAQFPDPIAVHPVMVERLRTGPDAEDRWYSNCLAKQVTARAFVDYCVSLVSATDTLPLLDSMCALPVPRLFVHGESNRTLSYLKRLAAAGVDVAEIRGSGHFPMYSNRELFLTVVGEFLACTTH